MARRWVRSLMKPTNTGSPSSGAANGNADGHRAAIGPQGQHLAAVAADQATTLALQVALNVGVVAGAIGLGHQDGYVLATTSSGRQPRMRSAAALKDCTRPCASIITMPSTAVSAMARRRDSALLHLQGNICR